MPAQSAMIRPNAEQLRLPLERPLAGEAFVSSDSNAEAVRVLSRWPDGAGSVLALYGPAGSGKSRLAADWAERVGAVPLNGVEAALVDPLELEGRPVLLDRARDADDESLFHLINLAHTGGPAELVRRPARSALTPGRGPDRRRRGAGRPGPVRHSARPVRRAQHRPDRRGDRLSGAAAGPVRRHCGDCGRTSGRLAPPRHPSPGPAGAGRNERRRRGRDRLRAGANGRP
jgi:hypothetical protein